MTDELTSIVAENLANLRKSKGLTQWEIAERFSYSDKSISKWERGEALPDLSTLKAFADFYGVTIDYLITKKEPKSENSAAKPEPNKNFQTKLMTCCFILSAVASVFAGLYAIFYISPIEGWPSFHFFFWMLPSLGLALWRYAHHIAWRTVSFAGCISTIWLAVLAVYLELGYDLGQPGWDCWFIFPIALVPTAIPVCIYVSRKMHHAPL